MGIPKTNGAVDEFNLPEWETTSRHRGDKQPPRARENLKGKALAHFNHVMPPHRKYWGLSRTLACLVIVVTVVAILVLIIGLAAGLSHHKRYIRTILVAGDLV